MQGAPIGVISRGSYIIDIMNSLPYDLAVPGNHEFDYGMNQFYQLSKNLTCDYISCNFRNLITGKLVFEPYKIISYGNVKVAFIGICTPETITKSKPSSFMNNNGNYIYDFDLDSSGKKLYDSVQKAVDDSRKNGADYVIVLGHLGGVVDATGPWTSSMVVQNTKGIDAFIDGHSHEVIPSFTQKNIEGIDVPITQSGSRFAYIGQVTITTDGHIKTELIDPVDIKEKDQKVTKIIKEIKDSYETSINVYLTKTDFDFEAIDEKGMWIVRKNETNLTDLVADSILSESKKYGPVDISLCNAGSIRGSIKKGNITINDILTIIPFATYVSISEMSGQTILDALEMSASKYPENNGGLLHTSGLTYSVDPMINSTVQLDERNVFIGISGKRRVYNVLVNGEPIDPKRRYNIASNSYILYEHGDGYSFSDSKIIQSNFALQSDLFIEYLKKFDRIPEKYRFSQGRLTFEKSKDNNNRNEHKRSKNNTDLIMKFEGLDILSSNEMMEMNATKEFLFKVYRGNEPISEITHLSFEVIPESSNDTVAEFIFDEQSETLKLVAKKSGVAEIGITYMVNITLSSNSNIISETRKEGIYTIVVHHKISAHSEIISDANSIYDNKRLRLLIFMLFILTLFYNTI
ncbi:Metallo-dependent phosphatase [Piromyces finnis]|uniref:Metallo-dependent phosphatase n=1 Tax=Piromyces finnis TaxID=1754191 RepID=A0A1Y1UZJ5_9FUNG|nr:Metallo-dependent phosphatase [Piromyces finnis]|eukprot:ORX43925.1 Metallo-dependent phosphatase [Piromyces finnis]